MRRPPLSRSLATAARRGFTLVELMVVIVILGGLIALVGPKVFTALGKGSKAQAQTQMKNFQSAIDMYFTEHRKLPSSLQDLTQEGKDGDSWMSSIPKDPWGNEYEYRRLDNKSKYIIRSAGEDGQPETEDDLTWPTEGSED
jgi:general secretion pathway protein G